MNRNPHNPAMPHVYDPSVSDALRDQSFARRNGLWVPARDTDLVLSDTTINDVATTKHGFAPKLPNDATKYLDGTGAYSVPAGAGATMADVRLWKTYFSTISRLPGTTIKEEINTWPAADYSNLNSGTLTRSKGHIKYAPINLHSNFGWALGANYNKVLIICQALRARNYNFGLTLGVTQPSTVHNPDGYLGLMETVNSAFKLYVCTGGTGETQLATSTDWPYGDSTSGPWVGLALYADGPGNIQELYVLQFGSAPYMACSATNNASAHFNSAGFFCGNQSNGVDYATVGLGIYAGN